MPRVYGESWVITGKRPVSTYPPSAALAPHPWGAGLEDGRIHDLRHAFASRALALGESLPMIGKLLGHTQVQTTARYAHLARNSVKVAAVRIADSLEADMDTPPDVSAAG